MARFAALYLPWVRLELARRGMAPSEWEAPLALVIARAGGAVKNERSLLGNTRLDEVSREARALGVRPGFTIAAARAKTSELRVRVVSLASVKSTLAEVAEAGLSFGTTVSFDLTKDVVCIDVTGCAHLHAPVKNPTVADPAAGEDELLAQLEARVRGMGYACRGALADGPRVAAAVARFFPRKGPVAVPAGASAQAMRALPLSAFPLGEASVHWLLRLGLRKGADLARLPPRALGTRLGAEARDVMALLRGEDEAPLVPYVLPKVPEESAELEYGVESTEALLFVIKGLCDRMAARLMGRAMAAARLVLELKLDRGVAREAEVPPKARIEVVLPTPLVDPAALLSVFRARLETFVVPAPVLALTLLAPELAQRGGRPLALFEAEARADRALPRLLAELTAELGEGRVGTLTLENSWRPEARSRLLPLKLREGGPEGGEGARSSSTPAWQARLLLPPAAEPSRLLTKPVPARSLHAAKLLSRVESAEWWKLGTGRRDYFAAWSEEERAMAWVELDHTTGLAFVRGWMD